MADRLPLIVLALVLSACASASPLVESRGTPPASPASFRLSGAPSGEGEAPAVERQVAAALEARGLREAAADAPADYLVEVALSDRPRGVAAAVPQEDGKAQTLTAAVGRSLRHPLTRGVASLTIRIVERVSGRELYRATATRPYRKPPAHRDLVRAALQPLGRPAS